MPDRIAMFYNPAGSRGHIGGFGPEGLGRDSIQDLQIHVKRGKSGMNREKPAGCAVCGRRARRNCSALDGVICNSCCGARRGTRIDCPPECAHFPFGREAYDKWLSVDCTWTPKAFEYVIDKVGKKEFGRMAEDFAPSSFTEEEAFVEGAEIALMNHLTSVAGGDHPSIGALWEKEGWPGLNNDERYMSEYRCRSLPGIVEIQKVLDDKAMECIDLLDRDRGRFIVFDRNTAKRTTRFDRILVWITHYPHFTRLTGCGKHLPDNLTESFLTEIRAMAKKTRGIQSGEAVKHYLAEHFTEAFDLIDDLRDIFRERMIASLDSDRCRAFYECVTPRAEIEAILEEKPDFEIKEGFAREPHDPPDVSYYSWLRRGEAKAIENEAAGLIRHGDEEEDGVGILGTVRLTNSNLMVETMGKVRFKFAKKLLRSYFRKNLDLMDEEITPIERLLEEHADSDIKREKPPDKIPPEIEARLLKRFYEKHYSDFLDLPVPMLDDMTPREASNAPAMRPILIELIKQHINGIDRMCAAKGLDVDISWIVDDLGLDELK